MAGTPKNTEVENSIDPSDPMNITVTDIELGKKNGANTTDKSVYEDGHEKNFFEALGADKDPIIIDDTNRFYINMLGFVGSRYNANDPIHKRLSSTHNLSIDEIKEHYLLNKKPFYASYGSFKGALIGIKDDLMIALKLKKKSRDEILRLEEFNGVELPMFAENGELSLTKIVTGCIGIHGFTGTAKTLLAEYIYRSLEDDAVYYRFFEPNLPCITDPAVMIDTIEDFIRSPYKVMIADSFRYLLFNQNKKSPAVKTGTSGVLFTDLTALNNVMQAFGKTLIFVINPLSNSTEDSDRLYTQISSSVAGMIKTISPGMASYESRHSSSQRTVHTLFYPLPNAIGESKNNVKEDSMKSVIELDDIKGDTLSSLGRQYAMSYGAHKK